MRSFLIHYETACGAHNWAVVECRGALPRSETLTWFAVYEVPAQVSLFANQYHDPVAALKNMARSGVLERVAL